MILQHQNDGIFVRLLIRIKMVWIISSAIRANLERFQGDTILLSDQTFIKLCTVSPRAVHISVRKHECMCITLFCHVSNSVTVVDWLFLVDKQFKITLIMYSCILAVYRYVPWNWRVTTPVKNSKVFFSEIFSFRIYSC